MARTEKNEMAFSVRRVVVWVFVLICVLLVALAIIVPALTPSRANGTRRSISIGLPGEGPPGTPLPPMEADRSYRPR